MEYDLVDRMEPLKPNEPRINFKNHKKNFQENPTIRLIYQNKSGIGWLSKSILNIILPLIIPNLSLKL